MSPQELTCMLSMFDLFWSVNSILSLQEDWRKFTNCKSKSWTCLSIRTAVTSTRNRGSVLSHRMTESLHGQEDDDKFLLSLYLSWRSKYTSLANNLLTSFQFVMTSMIPTTERPSLYFYPVVSITRIITTFAFSLEITKLSRLCKSSFFAISFFSLFDEALQLSFPGSQ